LRSFTATKGMSTTSTSRMPGFSRLPTSAAAWEPTATALFLLTCGRFDPRNFGTRFATGSASEMRARGMISVITPTTTGRHAFHPLLYENFCAQTHEPRELVVVDTGERPSAFLEAKARQDPRVAYHFFPVSDSCAEKNRVVPRHFWKAEGGPEAWTLGLKRNIACCLSRGVAIAHFDDDDLYAPSYLSFMWQRLLEAEQRRPHMSLDRAYMGLAPAAVTLAEWHLMDFSDRTFSFMNPEKNDLILWQMKRPMQYGFGFTHVYTWAAWKLEPFADVEFSEDGLFTQGLEAKGGELRFVHLPPHEEALAAHSYHPDSTSGGAAYVRFSGKVPTPEPFRALLPVAEAVAINLRLKKSHTHWMEQQIREEQARAHPHRMFDFGESILQGFRRPGGVTRTETLVAAPGGLPAPDPLPPPRDEAGGAPTTWKVVGGSGSDGIRVRVDRDLRSQQLPTRLGNGSRVVGLQQVGGRLHYRKLEGAGPSSGWVSLTAKGRALLQPQQQQHH